MQTLFKTTNAYKILSSREQKHHAYLLVYPDAAGIQSMLKLFSPLFFENEQASRVESGACADCLYLPEEGKKFTVETAELVSEEAVLRPVEGEKKLFVLSDVSEATTQAQNKLLKILEEPPEGVYFLLCATSESTVLPTVLSRVEKLQIPPFSTAQIAAFLKRNHPETPLLKETAALSGGYPGKAENLLFGGVLSDLTEAAFSLALAPVHALPALVKKHGESGYKKELLSLLRMIFRDALFLKTGEAQSFLLPSEKARVETLASTRSFACLVYAQEAFSSAEKDLKFNAVFPQTLELTLAGILRFNQDTVAP